MWRLAAAGLALAVAFQAAAVDEGWTLGPDGFGPFRIGMSFAQAHALAPGLAATPARLLASEGCDQLPLPGHPGVALMFVDGVLHRVDVFGPGVRAGGVAVGDPVARITHAYAGIAQEPNAYDERESYLTAGPDQGRAIRFETDKGRIGAMYAGDWPQVQYTEGCL
jgi:hypothetical protein